jgi:hypothetical protein
MRRLVLGIAVAVTSLVPSFGMANDQQIADYIKGQLQVEQQQGNLRGFNVDMNVEGGTVWFKGYVATPQQEMTILRAAQQAGHLGVVQVVDDIEVSNGGAAQAQYATQAGQTYDQVGPEAVPVAYQQPQFQTPQTTQPAYQGPASYGQPTYAAQPETYVTGGEPLAFATAANPGMMGGLGSPMPAGMSAPAAGAPSGSPNLPGYAWPGYAAHPNFGGVSYPKQYSASAWPYIGPFYPYPQVPLGWRKVTLEWDDGFWMLDFNDK